jgi:hypothetical protein
MIKTSSMSGGCIRGEPPTDRRSAKRGRRVRPSSAMLVIAGTVPGMAAVTMDSNTGGQLAIHLPARLVRQSRLLPAGIDHKAVAKVLADETLCHLIEEQDSLSYVMLPVRCEHRG